MGIFSRREKLVERRLRIKVPANGQGIMQFTLDEPTANGGSVWWACWANLMLSKPVAAASAVDGLADRSMAIVRAQLPSMTEVELTQGVDTDTSTFEGSASFLRSEWNAVKNLATLSEMLMPRSREIVRLSTNPIVLSPRAA